MFGPLNGVRTALVVLAVLAAVSAIALGHRLAGLVLLAAVGVHGMGWWYLYRIGTHPKN